MPICKTKDWRALFNRPLGTGIEGIRSSSVSGQTATFLTLKYFVDSLVYLNDRVDRLGLL